MSLLVRRTDFALSLGELKCFERSSDSGRSVQCFFCPDCGTRIYHVPAYVQGIVNIKPGTLDDRSWLRPDAHVWLQSQQAWFGLPEGVDKFMQQP